MLRVHFTDEDLLRVRLAHRTDPLWEIVCATCRLQSRHDEIALGSWRRQAISTLSATRQGREIGAMLMALMPVAPYIPDFLTPSIGSDLETGIDQVLSTPRRRIAAELSLLATRRHAPGWLSSLANAEHDALAALGTALRTFHREVLAPVESAATAQVAATLARLTAALHEGGALALLESLRPAANWTRPVLQVQYPVDQDLYLNGRGLALVPSFFCDDRPVTLANATLPPVLIFPIVKDPAWQANHGPRELAGVIGTTRANILVTLADGGYASTGTVAESVHVSLATASQQLTLLRAAGLLVSCRDGKRVLHTLTRVGADLVHNQNCRNRSAAEVCGDANRPRPPPFQSELIRSLWSIQSIQPRQLPEPES